MYKKGQTGTFRYVTRESIYFVLSMEFSILFNETAYKSELYSWGKKCSIQNDHAWIVNTVKRLPLTCTNQCKLDMHLQFQENKTTEMGFVKEKGNTKTLYIKM